MAFEGFTVSGIASGALNIAVIIGTIIVVGGFLVFLTWFIMYKVLRYNYRCVIFDQNNITASQDKAGIFVDGKTKNKRFFLQKYNVGLDPNNVPWKLISGKKTVFLIMDGLKNFRFLDINIKPNPGAYISVGEEDVNWAINDYEKQKKLFQDSKLLQFMPYIAIAFVSIIILTIFIYFFKEFSSLSDMAQSLKEAALAIREAKSGTTIIP